MAGSWKGLAAGSTPCASCASQPIALIILGLGLTATANGNEADFEFVNTVVSILSFAAVLLAYGMLSFRFMIDRLAPRVRHPDPGGAAAWSLRSPWSPLSLARSP